MRLWIFFLALIFIVTTWSKPWSKPWSQGRSCSKKVVNLCRKKMKCMNTGKKCENLNKKEPKLNNKKNPREKERYKKSYCRNVRCIKSGEECSCPMYHDPVCGDQ